MDSWEYGHFEELEAKPKKKIERKKSNKNLKEVENEKQNKRRITMGIKGLATNKIFLDYKILNSFILPDFSRILLFQPPWYLLDPDVANSYFNFW